MKKKLLSLALALALCLSLTVPAMAARAPAHVGNDKNTITINGGTDLGAQSFQVQNWTHDDSGESRVTTKLPTETLALKQVIALPADAALVVTNKTGIINDGAMECQAWSDPDGDGIYEGRVSQAILNWGNASVSIDQEVLPTGTAGPLKNDFEGFAAEDGSSGSVEAEYSYFWSVSCEGSIYFYTMGYGDGSKEPAEIPASYLMENFGGNTLFRLSFRGLKDSDPYDDYYFLLTEEEKEEETPPETSGEPAAEAPVNPFTDVASDSPYYDAILWAVEQGITTGTGDGTTFSPAQSCTTGQILTFLWRASGSPESTIENPFTDSISSAFQKAAIWAYEKELVSGDVFGASTPCTRSATVTYLWKLAGSPAAGSAAAFEDVSEGGAQAVSWAVEQGITTGYTDGTFRPDATCNRGQIVTFLYRNMGPKADA